MSTRSSWSTSDRSLRWAHSESSLPASVLTPITDTRTSSVKLLEYDNIDGMILLSELSRRRIRSIQKLIRVGRNEVVVVLRVDKEKGYIDLSKRRVSPEDVLKCEDRYNKAKMVHSIMRHVAEKTSTPMEDLYKSIGWPLDKKYGSSLDAFRISISKYAAPATYT